MERCCVECFRDPVLRTAVQNTGELGNCDICGAADAYSADLSVLSSHFSGLLQLYDAEEEKETETQSGLLDPESFLADHVALRFGRSLSLMPHLAQGLLRLPTAYYEGAKPLPEILHTNWAIFSDALSAEARQVLTERILEAIGEPRGRAAERWKWLVKPGLVVSKIHTISWDLFAKHLKNERRFIPDTSRLTVQDMRSLFRISLSLTETTIDATTAQRARRGSARAGPTPGLPSFMEPGPEPRPLEEMGAPPGEQTTDGGRLNPPGIPFLYLADDERTAVAEIRPAMNDLVSVAAFTTSRTLKIADLTNITPLDSPFGHDDLVNEVEIRRLLEEVGRQLSQPVNPDSDQIEYVPTQFFAEVVRDADFHGIAYPSALGQGTNLVLFDPDDAEPQECRLVRVTKVQYSISELSLAETLGLGGPPLPPRPPSV